VIVDLQLVMASLERSEVIAAIRALRNSSPRPHRGVIAVSSDGVAASLP
jgi:hypothetical protein